MRFARIIDFAILALIISAAVLFWTRSESSSSPETERPQPPVVGLGTLIPPSVVAPGPHPQVVLFLSVDCGACNSSVGFYRKLGAVLAKAPFVDFVVLAVDDPALVRQWLGQHRIEVDRVSLLEVPESIGLIATPTLMIVADGIVEDIVVGVLNETENTTFTERALYRDRSLPIERGLNLQEVEEHQWTAAEHSARLTLDIRSREEFRAERRLGSVNVPFDEVATRIPAEYPPSTTITIDCTVGDLMNCRMSASSLQTVGFNDVKILVPSRSK